MKSKLSRWSSGLLALTLVFALAFGFGGNVRLRAFDEDEAVAGEEAAEDEADASKTYTQYYDYSYDAKVNKGIYLVPEKEGKYPLLFLFHGSGGIGKFKSYIVDTMNKWVELGLIEPMVVIIPEIDKIIDKDWGETDFGDFVREGRMETILNMIKNNDANAPYAAKVDQSRKYSVAGYSMGGALALYVGVYYKDLFPNVCGGSPAYPFCSPGAGKKTYVTKESDVQFSSESCAHLVMGYGLKSDEDLHKGLAEKYLGMYNKYKGSNPNEFKMYNEYNGGHTWDTFKREIFYFLYYVNHDVVPDAETIEQACGTNGLSGTVTISGNQTYGSTLTATVSNGNASSYTYTWKRGTTTVGTSASYTTVKADIGQILTCEVKDKSGTKVGKISASTAAIQKLDGPAKPSVLSAKAPSEKGLADGSISGVSTSMEYATKQDFSDAKACTGTTISNLKAGTYYIRVKATDTTKAGKVETVVVPEGPEKTTPVEPDPVNPDPQQPSPVDPDPSNPDPQQPSPVDPDPTKPNPVKDPSFEDFIERMYVVALNRESEPEGKAFWMDKVKNEGFTGGRVAIGFLIEAPEFLNRNLSDSDFVDVLYKTFFDRSADESGKAFWMGHLASDMTREQVVRGFIDSIEWCNLCAYYNVKSGAPNAKAEKASSNALKFATRLYTECLGREPDEDGLLFWALRLTNLESSGYEAAKGFFESKEFTNKNVDDETYVKLLYRTFMGRDFDQSGLEFWLGHLSTDMTRLQVLQGFAQSQEFTNICNEYGIDRGTI